MSDSINYGIAGGVKATAVAVGTGAKAVVNETRLPSDRANLEVALRELSSQLAALQIAPAAHELLRGDIEKLSKLAPADNTARDQASGIFERLTEKLKMVNVALDAVAPLGSALKKIATLFGPPLPF
jgi:hypothetical protein